MIPSRFLIVAGSLILAAASHAQTTLYSQPFAQTANGGYFASVTANYYQYDSFRLSTDATVNSLSWFGVDLNELINVTPINPTSFRIGIYADSAGLPGGLISQSTIGNSGNATNTGQSLMGLTLYGFSGALTTPVSVKANTTYWLQIIDPTTNNDWFWASGTGNDATHVATVGSATNTFADDMSFTLSGVKATPEPGTLAALGLGATVLVRGARRRRAQASDAAGA